MDGLSSLRCLSDGVVQNVSFDIGQDKDGSKLWQESYLTKSTLHNVPIFLLDFLDQKFQSALRPFKRHRQIRKAGLGYGQHCDHEVKVGEKAKGDNTSGLQMQKLGSRLGSLVTS